MVRVWVDEAAKLAQWAWCKLLAAFGVPQEPGWVSYTALPLAVALATWHEAQVELRVLAEDLRGAVGPGVVPRRVEALLDSAAQLRTAVNRLSDLVEAGPGKRCACGGQWTRCGTCPHD